ncbi:MAG: Transcriptional regulator SlyA [Candidatus Dichloromethanomonas elyunquensis]|nr:MAG: Transcriptional regulator SlyA [Candidatus Dichloromethanomonas elyunquensis]
MMERSFSCELTELLVRTFNDILAVEEYEIQKGPLNNLTITEIHTIEAIGMYRSRTMSQVAAGLGITVGALTSTINHLVEKGYVSRERDISDRRIVNIRLTKEGKIAFRIHEKFHLEVVRQTVKGLTEKENILIESLQKLNTFLNTKYLLNN